MFLTNEKMARVSFSDGTSRSFSWKNENDKCYVSVDYYDREGYYKADLSKNVVITLEDLEKVLNYFQEVEKAKIELFD